MSCESEHAFRVLRESTLYGVRRVVQICSACKTIRRTTMDLVTGQLEIMYRRRSEHRATTS